MQAPQEITTPVTPRGIAVAGQGKIMPYSSFHLLNLQGDYGKSNHYTIHGASAF
jgi:hypothetical protein